MSHWRGSSADVSRVHGGSGASWLVRWVPAGPGWSPQPSPWSRPPGFALLAEEGLRETCRITLDTSRLRARDHSASLLLWFIGRSKSYSQVQLERWERESSLNKKICKVTLSRAQLQRAISHSFILFIATTPQS